jgi:protein-disulfide isomerase
MRRVLDVLVVLLIALTPAFQAQTPNVTKTKDVASGVSAQSAPQPNAQPEDCACEAQVLPDALAIVNGVKVSRQDIEKTTSEAVNRLQRRVIDARKRELDLQINSKLLALEAKRRGISTTKLLELEVVAKVKPATEAEAQLFYDQNKQRIQSDFTQAKEDLLHYLRDQREAAAAKNFAAGLRSANDNRVQIQPAPPPLSEADRDRVLAIVNGERITSGNIADSLRPLIFDVQERVYKLRRGELDLSINDILLEQEAQKRKTTTTALLDAEIKPKPVTEADASAFYEQNKDRVSGDFAQTKEGIVSYLQQIEVRIAEKALLDKLRAAAAIQTFLVAPEPPILSITTTDQPSLGNASAPVTIIAFTDYQCPSCAETHPTLERLVKEYGDRVRLVVRDFPLEQHVDASKAAEASEAAREQGKYWEYVEILLRNQSALGVDKLKGYASQLNLDRARFDKALDSGKFAEAVQRDLEEGTKLGIDSTPAVFINGRRVSEKSYVALKANIEAALKALPVSGSTQRVRPAL